MSKKNILTVIVSLALVVALGVGATLAYMTASANAITNTFTFANGMEMTVDEEEPDPTGDETITEKEDGGYDYDNVIPGQTLNKEPEITVTTTIDAYVFVRLSGFDASIACGGITTGWTAMSDVDANGNGTYYKAVTGASGTQDLGSIFSTVVVGTGDSISDVTIAVAAIQSYGFANAAAALEEATFQSASVGEPPVEEVA